MKQLRIVIFIILCLPNSIAISSPFICSQWFSSALQTHGKDSAITMECGVQIKSNANNFWADKLNVPLHCQPKCDGQVCNIKKSLPEIALADFKYCDNNSINDQRCSTLMVKQNDTFTFSENSSSKSIYTIDKLKLEENATIILPTGSYWIQALELAPGAVIKAEDDVFVYVLDDLLIPNHASIGGNAQTSGVWLIAYNNIEVKGVFVGNLYSKKSIVLKANSRVNGAVFANNIYLQQGSNIEQSYTGFAHVRKFCPNGQFGYIGVEPQGNLLKSKAVTINAKVYDAGGDLLPNYQDKLRLKCDSKILKLRILGSNGALQLKDNDIIEYQFTPQDKGDVKFVVDFAKQVEQVLCKAITLDGNVISYPEEIQVSLASQGFYFGDNIVNNWVAGNNVKVNLHIYGDGSGYTGQRVVKFWHKYINPENGTKTVLVNGNEIGTFDNPANMTLSFVNGKASLDLCYNDVGKIQVMLQDLTSGLQAKMQPIVVKPAKFVIDVANNPAAQDAGGPVFIAAGEPFQVKVLVQDSKGNLTANFGKEIVPESIRLFASLLAPQAGKEGQLNSDISFLPLSPGAFVANNVKFDEVGIIKLTAGVASYNYLGAGDVFGPASGPVGRFTPYHFVIKGNTPVIKAGCQQGGFSYFGQKLYYSVKPKINVLAQNKNNQPTENYTGDFWKLSADLLLPKYRSNGATFTAKLAQQDVVLVELGRGFGEIIFGDGKGLEFAKVSGENLPPLQAKVEINANIVDQDGVAFAGNPFVFAEEQHTGVLFLGGDKIYQGRIAMHDFFENSNSWDVPFVLQYYNGSEYVVNSRDVCTSVSPLLLVKGVQEDIYPLTKTKIFNKGEGLFEIAKNVGLSNMSAFEVTMDLSDKGINYPYLQYFWGHQQQGEIIVEENPISNYITVNP